ncbi:MAG TPA: hypothetical protein VGG28_05550 [Kofleriaceae bacterium]|jgi:hypothetical protein
MTVRYEHAAYNGKHYELPIFDPADPIVISPRPGATTPTSPDGRVVAGIHGTFDIAELRDRPRRPASLGVLTAGELAALAQPGATRVLDMPIKFPDLAEYRLPRALAQLAPVIQRIADVEQLINPHHAEYFAYLTIDQGVVEPSALQREAPCHVDGFQGQRWHPRAHTNHSYTVSDVLPTAYYVQPFDLTRLDETKHDFFWEMNAQVADTDEAFKWQPAAAELTVMDCYCVHRGVEATVRTPRTWLRLSFEERRRVFDRLGNAHNPLFDYAWPMIERDIEQLHLVAFRTDNDPSLNVFPWQAVDGSPLPDGAPKTKPRLRKSPTA